MNTNHSQAVRPLGFDGAVGESRGESESPPRDLSGPSESVSLPSFRPASSPVAFDTEGAPPSLLCAPGRRSRSPSDASDPGSDGHSSLSCLVASATFGSASSG